MSDANVYKWSLIDRVSVSVLGFAGNVVLTRMLTEADFGLLAMIAIFVAIAGDLSGCGMADGLIHKLRPSQRDYSTVFVTNATIGLFFGLLFFLGAPLFAYFYEQPALTGIMRVAGVCFFIQCMCSTQDVYMRKHLRMKALCFVRVGATISALALGITLAALGYGYWALVCTQMLLSVFMFIYFLIATRWLPSIRFCLESFHELFGYGVHLMLAYLGNIIAKNINSSVLGKAFSPAMSGIYYQGAKLAVVPFTMTETSINASFFVVASNEADDNRRRAMIVDMLPTLVGINALIMTYLIAVSRPAVELLYGMNWIAVVPVLRILAFYEFLAATKYFCQTICKIYDRTSLVRNLAFGEIALQLILLALMYRGGIMAVALTQVIAVIAFLTYYLYVCARATRMTIFDVLRAFWSALWLPIIAATISIAAYYCIETIIGTLNSFFSCGVITIAYAAAVIAIGETARPKIYITWRNKILKRK